MSTRTAKGKKRKRIGRLADKDQSARFILEARKLGLDETGKDFEKTMDSLLKKGKSRGNS